MVGQVRVDQSGRENAAATNRSCFQIAKVIANLIVIGSGILLRAVSQAYKQALINASKTGVAQETLQDIAEKSTKKMSPHEARMILGVSEKTPWEEILKKYENLFERNAKIGSFYIQSKVQRAKERLEAEKNKGQ
ncbi:hypothetical protein SELMODRAFT_76729 [Selaginella moellendorffii]|uniref:Uncharacterized protein n=1 Tax=Selaginella moellendorffii TaxID=88036 RepID=D8QSJ6_SELML|nr:mitochondrial import inner membrane translocase subunit PAM16 like 2 isoform X1 [Selaginella moellendorffii]EFJ37447.1 hypothetical protein SELMODRAFT_76729 [Selaginella moellendorffii]|eukprot:XP_002962187.1 mitochondrial import inner membrane translocase subunit PAM16 like 2 isoform X1 [Selaginella moellendorffii]